MGAMGILTSAALSVVLFIASSGLAYAVVQFEDVTAPAGVVTGSAQGSGLASGSAWRDFNGDGLPDLFVGNHYDLPVLFRNQGNGTFVDVVPLGVLKRPPDATGIWGDKHGSAWADFDNDGDRDLVIMSGAHNGTGSGATQLYVSGTEGLVDHAKALGIDYPLARKRTATWVDYDNDGRLDLFCGAILRPDGQAPATLFQQTATGFVDVRTPPVSSRSIRSASGSPISIATGGWSSSFEARNCRRRARTHRASTSSTSTRRRPGSAM